MPSGFISSPEHAVTLLIKSWACTFSCSMNFFLSRHNQFHSPVTYPQSPLLNPGSGWREIKKSTTPGLGSQVATQSRPKSWTGLVRVRDLVCWTRPKGWNTGWPVETVGRFKSRHIFHCPIAREDCSALPHEKAGPTKSNLAKDGLPLSFQLWF